MSIGRLAAPRQRVDIKYPNGIISAPKYMKMPIKIIRECAEQYYSTAPCGAIFLIKMTLFLAFPFVQKILSRLRVRIAFLIGAERQLCPTKLYHCRVVVEKGR